MNNLSSYLHNKKDEPELVNSQVDLDSIIVSHETTTIGDEYGDSILLFGQDIGEVVHVSSERPHGLFKNIQGSNGAWHSCSTTKVQQIRKQSSKNKNYKYSDHVEFAIVDFGGDGDDIYELDYMWLRNEHSTSYSVEYKDLHGTWILYQPWTSVEPFEFISLSKPNIKAAELKLLIKGSSLWDASWVMLKVYGRSDPITNFLRDLNAQIFSHDDLDLMKQLYQEGLKLNLRDRNEMQEALIVRDQLILKEQCCFAMERLDMVALKKLMEEASEKSMLTDVKVMEAQDVLAALIAEQNYKYSHPAYKLMINCDIDEASATKYLAEMINTGYDCMFGMCMIVDKVEIDNGEEATNILRNMLYIKNTKYRDKLLKMIPRIKLPRQDLNNGLEKFILSIGINKKDCKKYMVALWDNRKYDTLFDLLNCERDEMELFNMKQGHIEAVLFITNGKHAAYPCDEND